jgi:hypothetical protein
MLRKFVGVAAAGEARSVDASRITDSLKRYSKAVAAIRDVFGDNGRPDAPMNELLSALDGLTANTSSMLAPERHFTMA